MKNIILLVLLLKVNSHLEQEKVVIALLMVEVVRSIRRNRQETEVGVRNKAGKNTRNFKHCNSKSGSGYTPRYTKNIYVYFIWA